MTIYRTKRICSKWWQHSLWLSSDVITWPAHTVQFRELHIILLTTSTQHLINFFNDLLRATVLISLDDPGNIIRTLYLSGLALKIRTYRLWITVTNIVSRLILSMLTTIRISINQSDSLDVIANMMIVFVTSHNQVFFSFLDPKVTNWLSSITRYVYIGQILFWLSICALLISKAWQRWALLNVYSFYWLYSSCWVLHWTNTIQAIIYLRAIL